MSSTPQDVAARTGSAPRASAHPRGVHLTGVSRTFSTEDGPLDVLRGIDLAIAPGEILAVIGTSGCGKSTLLRLLAGLDRPSTGTIHIGDSALSGIDDRTAVAFQEPRLLPWRTLEDNVALGLPRGTPRADGRVRVQHLLELVGLSHAARRRPREVSGGMAQRASLARALARGPEVLLLDEPFGALDALTRLRMQDLLLELHQAEPTTVVVVTHDVEEALYLSDRVVQLRPLRDAPDGAASAARTITVPGRRPRDRAAVEFAELRADLLSGLGVDPHHAAPAAQH